MRSSFHHASLQIDLFARVATLALCAVAWCGCAVETSAGEHTDESSSALGAPPRRSLGTPSHAPICSSFATCDGIAKISCSGVPLLPPFEHSNAPLYIASPNGSAPFADWTAPNGADKASFQWSETPSPAHSETYVVCASAVGGALCQSYTVNFPGPNCGTPAKQCTVLNPAPGCIPPGGGGGLIQ